MEPSLVVAVVAIVVAVGTLAAGHIGRASSGQVEVIERRIQALEREVDRCERERDGFMRLLVGVLSERPTNDERTRRAVDDLVARMRD